MTDRSDPILSHFGLASDPFSLSPDPEFFFESPTHGDAHAALEIGVTRRRGLLVVTGEVGTGKTTVIRSLLGALPQEVIAAYVSSTTLAFLEILRRTLKQFGVRTHAHCKAGLLEALEDFVVEADRRDEICVLAIDEAQNLSEEAFEELRLLLNIESTKRKLLQIVLLGQPELDARLDRPEMRHIADRIAIRCHLGSLDHGQVREYLHHRLICAGGEPSIFDEASVRTIARGSHGTPRKINILANNALIFAYGAGEKTVDRATARAALREQRGTRGLSLPPRRRGSLSEGPTVGLDEALPEPLEIGSVTVVEALDRTDASSARPGGPVETAATQHKEVAASLQAILSCIEAITNNPRRLFELAGLEVMAAEARRALWSLEALEALSAGEVTPLPVDASLLLERELDEFDPEARLLGVWLRREIRDRALTTWADETLLRVALAGMLRTSLGLLGEGREAGLLVRYGGHGDRRLRIEMAGRRTQVEEPGAAETRAALGGGGPTVALALRVASRVAELHEGALELRDAEHGGFNLRLSLPAVHLDAQQR